MLKTIKLFCISLLLILLSNILITAAPSSPTISSAYNIKIKIKNYKDNICFLANYYGDKKYIKDTCKLKNIGDDIIFSGKQKLPQGIYLVVIPTMKYFELIIGEDQEFEIETDTTDFIGTMKIKGSVDNQLFLDYLKFTSKKGEELSTLSIEFKNAKTKSDSARISSKMFELDTAVNFFRKQFISKNPKMLLSSVFKAMPEPIVPKSIDETKMPGSSFRYFKEHYFDNFDFSDERLLYTPIFHAKIDKYLNQLTPQHPDSISVSADFLVNKSRANKENFKWMVWYITNIYEQSKVMGFDAVFVHMAENYYCKGEAFWIDTAKLTKICDRAAHLKKINLGAVVPNMFLEDTTLNGRFIYDLMKNDKYTIFWFWNSGCGHCQKETPELYKKWKEISKDLNIGVISITEERLGGKEEPEMNRWKKYFRDHPMPEWKNLRDANNYYDFKDMFDVYATPKLFIVESATHKIIAKSISVEQIDDVIKQYEKFEKNKDKPNNK